MYTYGSLWKPATTSSIFAGYHLVEWTFPGWYISYTSDNTRWGRASVNSLFQFAVYLTISVDTEIEHGFSNIVSTGAILPGSPCCHWCCIAIVCFQPVSHLLVESVWKVHNNQLLSLGCCSSKWQKDNDISLPPPLLWLWHVIGCKVLLLVWFNFHVSLSM